MKEKEEEFKDPIGDLRRALNQEILTKEQFVKYGINLKNVPEFFEIAKNNERWLQRKRYK